VKNAYVKGSRYLRKQRPKARSRLGKISSTTKLFYFEGRNIMLYVIIVGTITIIAIILAYRAGANEYDTQRIKENLTNSLIGEFAEAYTPERIKKIENRLKKVKAEAFASKFWAGFIALCISVGIATIIPCIIAGGSYSNYIDAKRFHNATHHQYEQAIQSYSDRALMNPGAKTALTDSKYNNYQDNIAKLIRDYRNTLINYNRIVVGKIIWKNNILFGWFIVELDPDMKELALK